jgi:signal transduction histidine kinase
MTSGNAICFTLLTGLHYFCEAKGRMTNPENRSLCQVDSTLEASQEQQRLATLVELGLLEADSIPVFEEATQTAAHFLNAPICVLGLVDRDRQWFKAAIGLSRIGLMNDLASSRQLPRQEAFCTQVINSRQVLMINNATAHPAFANSLLTQRYGIRAYLGVPLLAANGCCLGTLAIMEPAAREFTLREAELLELIARWGISEFERNWLLKRLSTQAITTHVSTIAPQIDHAETGSDRTISNQSASVRSIKVNLITQMTQELRTPLTSILGMTGILNREIYGPLSDKQKEYTDIVHNSGQYLLSLVNEILELGGLDDSSRDLDLNPIDIEMLCQQVLKRLEQVAYRREQQVRLTVEPGHRIWLLDKDKVHQMLYHLAFGVIQSSSAGSVIRFHVSRKQHQLSLTMWTSHPWLGEGLPQAMLASIFSDNKLDRATQRSDHFTEADSPSQAAIDLELTYRSNVNHSNSSRLDLGGMETNDATSNHAATSIQEGLECSQSNNRQSLGLTLSQLLAALHGGSITLQGSHEEGYRYVVTLPQLTSNGRKAWR